MCKFLRLTFIGSVTFFIPMYEVKICARMSDKYIDLAKYLLA